MILKKNLLIRNQRWAEILKLFFIAGVQGLDARIKYFFVHFNEAKEDPRLFRGHLGSLVESLPPTFLSGVNLKFVPR